MKRLVWLSILMTALAVGLVGCEWNTGDDAESWSSAFNWVNFSGTYRSAAGGILVSDYTTTPSTPGSTNTVNVSREAQGTVSLNQTAYNGVLRKTPVKPGSVVVDFGYFSAADNGNGVLTGPAGSGTISYSSGAWTFTGAPLAPGSGRVYADYSQLVSNEGSAGGGAVPGSTGRAIYSFVVNHQGQNLTITDNNGAVYPGRIKQMRSAAGLQNTDIPQVGEDEVRNDGRMAKYTYQESPLPDDGDMIVANFECSGTSQAGMQVRIVGTLEGTVAAGVFTGRRMDGTWIEAGGKTGNINGQTVAVPIATAPAEEAVEETTREPGGTGTRT